MKNKKVIVKITKNFGFSEYEGTVRDFRPASGIFALDDCYIVENNKTGQFETVAVHRIRVKKIQKKKKKKIGFKV